MELTVQIVGSIVDRLPGFDGAGFIQLSLDPETTVEEVLKQLDLYSLGGIAVLVNGQPVAREDRAGVRLYPNDTIVILPPIEGG